MFLVLLLLLLLLRPLFFLLLLRLLFLLLIFLLLLLLRFLLFFVFVVRRFFRLSLSCAPNISPESKSPIFGPCRKKRTLCFVRIVDTSSPAVETHLSRISFKLILTATIRRYMVLLVKILQLLTSSC